MKDKMDDKIDGNETKTNTQFGRHLTLEDTKSLK